MFVASLTYNSGSELCEVDGTEIKKQDEIP
jgi:hypothetical protein